MKIFDNFGIFLNSIIVESEEADEISFTTKSEDTLLKSGTNYSITLQASNEAGYSEHLSISFQTSLLKIFKLKKKVKKTKEIKFQTILKHLFINICPAWWRSGYYTYFPTRKYRFDTRWRHINKTPDNVC